MFYDGRGEAAASSNESSIAAAAAAAAAVEMMDARGAMAQFSVT